MFRKYISYFKLQLSVFQSVHLSENDDGKISPRWDPGERRGLWGRGQDGRRWSVLLLLLQVGSSLLWRAHIWTEQFICKTPHLDSRDLMHLPNEVKIILMMHQVLMGLKNFFCVQTERIIYLVTCMKDVSLCWFYCWAAGGWSCTGSFPVDVFFSRIKTFS